MEKYGEVRSTWKYMLWGMKRCKFRLCLSLAYPEILKQAHLFETIRRFVFNCLSLSLSHFYEYGKSIGDRVQQCLDASNLSFAYLCICSCVLTRLKPADLAKGRWLSVCCLIQESYLQLKVRSTTEKPDNPDVQTIADRTWLNVVPGIPWQDQCRADLADYLRQTWCPCQSETRFYVNCENACNSLCCLMLLGRFAFY